MIQGCGPDPDLSMTVTEIRCQHRMQLGRPVGQHLLPTLHTLTLTQALFLTIMPTAILTLCWVMIQGCRPDPDLGMTMAEIRCQHRMQLGRQVRQHLPATLQTPTLTLGLYLIILPARILMCIITEIHTCAYVPKRPALDSLEALACPIWPLHLPQVTITHSHKAPCTCGKP